MMLRKIVLTGHNVLHSYNDCQDYFYDAQKNSLDSRYSYEGRYDKDEELLPNLEFEKWFEEVKESQE